MYHCGLVHTPIPIPNAKKRPAAKAAVVKEWSKLKMLPAWSGTMADVTRDAQAENISVHFAPHDAKQSSLNKEHGSLSLYTSHNEGRS